MDNKLAKIVEQSGLQPAQAKSLLESFGDFYVQAHRLKVLADEIKVTDISQTEEMQKAREVRIELKNLRNDADKVRVVLKADYLRGGNAVQDIFNGIRDITKPIEERLLEQEQYVKRIKALEDEKTEKDRIAKLSKYVEDVDVYNLHPSKLSTESFDKLLGTSKIAFEANQEVERKAEEDRLAKEKAERDEQERIRKENDKLKKDAEEKEKAEAERKRKADLQFAKEKKAREQAEAKLKAEKDAQAKAEADKKAKEEVEAKVKEESERKALLAPDREKLIDFTKQLSRLERPALKDKKSQEILNQALEDVDTIITNIEKKVKEL